VTADKLFRFVIWVEYCIRESRLRLRVFQPRGYQLVLLEILGTFGLP
jgi:hypothetical protein